MSVQVSGPGNGTPFLCNSVAWTPKRGPHSGPKNGATNATSSRHTMQEESALVGMPRLDTSQAATTWHHQLSESTGSAWILGPDSGPANAAPSPTACLFQKQRKTKTQPTTSHPGFAPLQAATMTSPLGVDFGPDASSDRVLLWELVAALLSLVLLPRGASSAASPGQDCLNSLAFAKSELSDNENH